MGQDVLDIQYISSDKDRFIHISFHTFYNDKSMSIVSLLTRWFNGSERAYPFKACSYFSKKN